jgi:gas vesicle protein GvpL/GvpF
VADELARWAAGRAPELLKRAEEDAVAVLRDALVKAATGERSDASRRARTPRPAQGPSAPAAPRAREAGELLWAYCVLDANDPVPTGLVGLDAAGSVERVDAAGLAALVSRVPAEEFGAEPLRDNLNELAWLERVARSHEAVLERAMAVTTIVPLRICTLYENQDGVRRMLDGEHDALMAALERLSGRQEWGVKVLVDPERLADEARARSADAGAYEEDLATRTEGGAYMLHRRLERHVREVADALAAELTEDIHGHLRDRALDAVTRPPQNPDLSGHEGEMLLNAAYLVDADRVEALRVLVAELQDRHGPLGVRLDLTGPWPPYNFVPGEGAGPIP